MAAARSSDLFARALDLPADERLALATQLLDSIEEPEDDAWAEAWAAELERRVRALEQGTMRTVPWDEVKSNAVRRLRSR